MKSFYDYIIEKNQQIVDDVINNSNLINLIKKCNLVFDRIEDNKLYYRFSDESFNICKYNLIFKDTYSYHNSGYIDRLIEARRALIYKALNFKKKYISLDTISTDGKTKGEILLRHKRDGLGYFGIIKENNEYKIYFEFLSSEKWAQNYLIRIAEFLLTKKLDDTKLYKL